MVRHNVLTLAALGIVLLAKPCISLANDLTSQPNIILVFIDDMGWADLSCFGNKEAKTPHIDRMAAEGLAFEQFYVNSPICSPSRVAISTGQYPQRWRITSYLNNRRSNRERGMANWLDPKAPMLARRLKEAGYATGHFGKWHMGGQRDVADAPPITAYGFDKTLTNFEGMGPKLLPLTMKPGWKEPGRIWADAERLGEPVFWMQRSMITGGFVDAALTFVNKAEADKKPFYINLWPDDVHSPFFPPITKWGKNKRDLYLAVLEEMDAQLGLLFDYVKEHKALRDNTLILICSDNGHEPGAGQAGVLRGSKANLYEGGIRSPLIVWAPKLVKANAQGTRNATSLMAAIDIAPSLLELTGLETPPDIVYDGQSLLDTLLGKSKKTRNAPVYFSRPPDRKDYAGFKNLPDLAIRDGQWKLLCDYDSSRPELYRILEDPSESNNLADVHPDIANNLTKKVVDWYQLVSSR